MSQFPLQISLLQNLRSALNLLLFLVKFGQIIHKRVDGVALNPIGLLDLVEGRVKLNALAFLVHQVHVQILAQFKGFQHRLV